MTGIGQLIAAHPGEARRHAASLLDSLAPRVSDGDEGVRAALLAVMRGPVSAALGPEGLAPFAPLLLAHASAALSHLSADVRLDALGVLEALAVSAPRAIVREPVALSGLLRHYCGLLGRAHRGKSVRSQALAGLLRVLSSLERLLAAAQPPASTLGSGGNSGGSGGTTDGPVPAPAGAPPEGLLLPLAAARAARAPLTATRLPQAEELLRRYADTASAAPISASLGRSTAPNAAAAAAAAAGGYRQPPKEILDIVDAPAQPGLTFSPDRSQVPRSCGSACATVQAAVVSLRTVSKDTAAAASVAGRMRPYPVLLCHAPSLFIL